MNKLTGFQRPSLFDVLYSADSILTRCVQTMTGEEKSAVRLSFYNGYDLGSGARVRAVLREIDQRRPQHVWLSLKCGPFSRMQSLNRRTPKQ